MIPVRVKSIEQQALQGSDRTRSLWMGTRTSRINVLRGFCREFGIVIAQGSRLGVEQISRALVDPHAAVPVLIRGTMAPLVEEIRLLEVRIAQLERESSALARESPACTTLSSIPGVGLADRRRPWWRRLPARSATIATRGTSPPGSASRPKSIRRAARAISVASPSAATATSPAAHPRRALGAACRQRRCASGKRVDGLRQWALGVQRRSNHNKVPARPPQAGAHLATRPGATTNPTAASA